MKHFPFFALLIIPCSVTWAQMDIDFETFGHNFSWKVFGNLEDELPDESVLWTIIDNPAPSEANTSAKVMQFTIQEGATVFAGMYTDDLGPFLFTDENKIVTIAVRKGVISDFDSKWENASGAIAEDIFVTNTVTDEWEILTFDCSILLGQLVTRMVIIPDFVQGTERTSHGTIEFDSITFSSGEVIEPVNRELIVNGKPFIVRGVCYQPTPLGADPSASEPFGDYYTSNYSALWDRDLPLLRAMGANTLRIYGWNDTANHDAFLDACYNDGVDPIYVLINRFIAPNTNWNDSAAVNAISTSFTNIDSRLGDHPAVIGIILGNEVNIQNGNGDNPAFWSAMNSIAGDIKAQTPGRLISVAITDALPQVEAFDASLTHLDFWSMQVYRGVTFGNFFNQYAAVSDKPLVMTEYGLDNWDAENNQPFPNNGQLIADTLTTLWQELNSNTDIAAGGCVFEFTDEWWKGAGLPNVQDNGGFVQGGFPDGFSNEEWYGLFQISQTPGGGPDTLTPRPSYAALQSLWLGSEPLGPFSINDLAPEGGSLRVSWESRAGSSYIIEKSVDLITWQIIQTDIPSAGDTSSTLIELDPTQEPEIFLRVLDR